MGAMQAEIKAQQSAADTVLAGGSSLAGSGVLDRLFEDSFLKQLDHRAEELAPQYMANKPFPHIYFDNFLPQAVADLALEMFPTRTR